MNKIKPLIQIAALALGALTLNTATAHGGVGQVVNDVNFELVAEAEGATIYVVDHDAPVPCKGIAGKLTVLQSASKTEVGVREAGDDKLRVTGVKLFKGDKVVAVLNNVEGKTATLRFTVK